MINAYGQMLKIIFQRCLEIRCNVNLPTNQFSNLEHRLMWMLNISHIRSVDTFHITAAKSLHWRHNDQDGVSNHQPHGCLLKRLFGRRSKKTSKLRVTGLCAWNSPGPVNSPHKGPVTRKIFPFDDVIMFSWIFSLSARRNGRSTQWVLWHLHQEQDPVLLPDRTAN